MRHVEISLMEDDELSQHQTVLSADAFDAFAAAVDALGTRNPTLGALLQRRNDLFQDGKWTGGSYDTYDNLVEKVKEALEDEG
tara:strand:- start:1201 stop:1449 length:249 start_codon:yes stop_codon:yes gene_type:complete